MAVSFVFVMDNDELDRHPPRFEHSSAAIGNEGEIKVPRDCYASLTPREQEVMKLAVSGMLNKQVGLKLGISEITVKAHRGKVMQDEG